MSKRRGRSFAQLATAAVTAAACFAAAAHGQESYPSRLITVVAPITAGTAIDILARLYADKLAKRFGQQVVVANRPGAGGLIGAQTVASSAPDGYTVLFANSGHAILGTLNKNLPFDPVADFAGVALVGEAPAIVVVPPSLGVSSLQEFVALAKSKPGEINYGSAGIGTSTHLAGAYFALKAGIDIVHVPYTVSATIIADLLGGRIQASFVPMAFVLPLLQDGRLKALAVAAKEPIAEPIAIATAQSQGIDYTRPGTACWRRGKRRSPSSTRSARRSPRLAKTPSCRRKSASRGSSRATSLARHSTPISVTKWCASPRC